MIWFSCLCLFLFSLPSPLCSSSFLPSPFTPRQLCHPHESSALFHFRNSFSIINDSLKSCLPENGGIHNPNSTLSWDISKDCCTWSGVTCHEVTGHVIRLDLKCGGLRGAIHSNSSLFFLTHLQTLILSSNNFSGSEISPQFGRFASMIHLDLSLSFLMGQVPLNLSYLSSLVALDLSSNTNLRLETSSLKRIVANLTHLRELFFHDVNMSSVSPNSFLNLSTSLRSLVLSRSRLTGEFPKHIFHLPKLQNLDLSINLGLNGTFPQYNWSSPLRNLNLSETEFLIDLPYLTKTLKSLNSLFLRACNFKGLSHVFLGNLTEITSLDLSRNNFHGQISWSSLNLEKLTYLDLSTNNFFGKLPEIFYRAPNNTFSRDSSEHQPVGFLPLNLKYLYLSDNVLNGTIPTWLYSLPYLQDLDLARNQFTGPIDEFQSTSLVTISLESNKLQGLIPQSIFQKVNLSFLDLSSNNLSGVMQLDQFSKLKNLQSLDLSFNRLISLDSINSITSALPNTLRSLSLSSCNMSEFPHALRSFENLEWLDLSNNQIEGIVPQWFWNVGKDSLWYLNISHNLLTHMEQIPWKEVNYIDLSSNRLQGHIPNPPPSTRMFSISNNQFVGEISSLFCNLTLVDTLDLSNNNLIGSIPPCSGLARVTMGNSLRILNLHGNQLEGSLPLFLQDCENLEILDVGNNKLNGSFPHLLASLPELQILIMKSNRFHGPISNPEVRFPFHKLRIMDLSNNEFTGLLPAEYFGNFTAMMDAHSAVLKYMGRFPVGGSYYSVTVAIKGQSVDLPKIQTMFMTIDFSSNNFTGEIPKVIGKLNSLKGLSFSHNKLFGLIPQSLANLNNLEWLDLSSNKLSGRIPSQIAEDLNQLSYLNLSNNRLEGPIPPGKQFETFNSESYCGNLGLCGFPLPQSCTKDEAQQDQGDDDGEHDSGMIEWKVVMMGYASGIVIGISVGYMVLFSRSFDHWFFKRFGIRRRCRTNTRSRRRRRSN